MTAFGQQHGGGLCLAVPVAADVAVALVDVAHRLYGDDRLHLADGVLHQQGFHPFIELGVAQHVAHQHLGTVLFGGLGDVRALGGGLRHRLFQQQVIAQRDGLHRRLVVPIVGGGDDQQIRQLGAGHHVLPRVKA